MIPDLDIYCAANGLVKHHGEDAPIEAAMRADAERGDELLRGARGKRLVYRQPCQAGHA